MKWCWCSGTETTEGFDANEAQKKRRFCCWGGNLLTHGSVSRSGVFLDLSSDVCPEEDLSTWMEFDRDEEEAEVVDMQLKRRLPCGRPRALTPQRKRTVKLWSHVWSFLMAFSDLVQEVLTNVRQNVVLNGPYLENSTFEVCFTLDEGSFKTKLLLQLRF